MNGPDDELDVLIEPADGHSVEDVVQRLHEVGAADIEVLSSRREPPVRGSDRWNRSRSRIQRRPRPLGGPSERERPGDTLLVFERWHVFQNKMYNSYFPA
jgi:hypothetical protein